MYFLYVHGVQRAFHSGAKDWSAVGMKANLPPVWSPLVSQLGTQNTTAAHRRAVAVLVAVLLQLVKDAQPEVSRRSPSGSAASSLVRPVAEQGHAAGRYSGVSSRPRARRRFVKRTRCLQLRDWVIAQ